MFVTTIGTTGYLTPSERSPGKEPAVMIHETTKKLGSKELKVNIPVTYHLRLHSLKLVEGRQIHAVVQAALDRYFESLRTTAA